MRKTKRDWFINSVQILLADGPQGLTIDALCKHLGVTKGSFYHHFGSYERYKQQFLAFYEAEGTLNIIERLADLPSPQAKLQRLLNSAVEFSTRQAEDPDVAMRAWALQDTAVRHIQTRVDGRRREYVQQLCEEIIGDAAQAQTIANLLYAILVGSEQMQPPLVGEDLRHLFNECLRLYDIELIKDFAD
ncbi:TetR/AcrR family transcriptional regulator [Candidatus Leptofilum sp.]|uniref:TetR/AcrR family transcriptional regulator n=1 Tax=Candidatus Leptofilum sp. TaxID=3241576 RepID=UPI003B5AD5F0